MVIEYKWARELYDYVVDYLNEYYVGVPDKLICCADYYNGCLYLDNEGIEIDLCDFKYLYKVVESELCGSTFNMDFIDENLIKCVDECADLLFDMFGWSPQSSVELEVGNVEYKDFLPERGDVSKWKNGSVPSRVTDEIFNLCQEVLNNDSIVASKEVKYFEQVPLMRIFMSDKGLTLGVWDSKYGSDDYYAEIYDGKSGSFYLEGCLHCIVGEVLKIGVQVRDVFILTRGTCDRMYYRKNSDGEYTITIY